MLPLLRRNLLRSLTYALAASLAAYAFVWGMFTTHPEAGLSKGAGLAIALWVLPVVFLASILIYAAKSSGARRH